MVSKCSAHKTSRASVFMTSPTKSSRASTADESATKSSSTQSGTYWKQFLLSIVIYYLYTHACSGELKPGLNAIMGPTGSGKTRYVDVVKCGWPVYTVHPDPIGKVHPTGCNRGAALPAAHTGCMHSLNPNWQPQRWCT